MRDYLTAENAKMLSDHAIVETQGFKIPLIGIPPAAMLEECGLCHDEFPLSQVQFTDGEMLCEKCRGEHKDGKN